MKKSIVNTLCFVIIPVLLSAQIKGVVKSLDDQIRIEHAVIQVEHSLLIAESDSVGNFILDKKEFSAPGRLIVSRIGFYPQSVYVSPGTSNIEILLMKKPVVSDEAAVEATRFKSKQPHSYSVINKSDLESKNFGLDFPSMISFTPSAVSTSDAGNHIGYTGIRIRGSDATRINVTINGVPVNDAESHQVYWVDLPDFAASVEDIQVQRGLGTSTNGTGAFGGSININTSGESTVPFGKLEASYGSFNSQRQSVSFGTGIFGNGFSFHGRLTSIKSDGFVDRASSDLESYFVTAGFIKEKYSVKLLSWSGKEKTYQAWNGVPEAKLRGSQTDLINHYNNNIGYLYNSAEDSLNLFNSDNRTYNYFTYKNQVDNYLQRYYQLIAAIQVSPKAHASLVLHHTHGEGYYEEFKQYQELSSYNLLPVIIGTDTINNTNLIRRKWLDNDFMGATGSVNIDLNKVNIIVGANAYHYDGNHFGKVIWAQYASNSAIEQNYYFNDAEKNEFGLFAKAGFSVTKNLELLIDLQIRQIAYSFLGYSAELNLMPQSVDYSFFNPKAGTFYSINNKSKLYLTVAKGNKEPVRDDFVNSSTLSRPEYETMIDIEMGCAYRDKKIKAGLNLFNMIYRNQLVLNGKINDVGEYNRENVKDSYRRGIEAELAYQFGIKWLFSSNLTISQNKIRNFLEYVDDYDAGSQAVTEHGNTNIAFSPAITAYGSLRFLATKGLSIELLNKFVGRQYLDNTEQKNKKLDDYSVMDLAMYYNLPVKNGAPISFKATIYNLLDRKYESNGYTYSYIYNSEKITENFYFPQSGRWIMAGIVLKF